MEGYKSFRIPAILGIGDEQRLAFAEGRREGGGDFGDIEIVVKRSKDKGRSWSTIQTVAD